MNPSLMSIAQNSLTYMHVCCGSEESHFHMKLKCALLFMQQFSMPTVRDVSEVLVTFVLMKSPSPAGPQDRG